MQKRRDRIERWRAERKRKELESAKKEVQKGSLVSNIQMPAKKWSLEDDSGDEGEIARNGIYFKFLFTIPLFLHVISLFASHFHVYMISIFKFTYDFLFCFIIH